MLEKIEVMLQAEIIIAGTIKQYLSKHCNRAGHGKDNVKVVSFTQREGSRVDYNRKNIVYFDTLL